MCKGSHFHQPLLLFIFFIIAILVAVKWYLVVVLIYTSLVNNPVKNLFMCFLAICVPFPDLGLDYCPQSDRTS